MPSGPADLYDALYDALGKDYVAEARTVLGLVRARRSGRAPASLLDVACGTGRHVGAFSRTLRCVGVDRDPAMLDVALRRCPDARFTMGDMERLDLGERFDVVTCLFGSIAYLPTVRRLRRAIRALAAHLGPGGVLVVEPWYDREQWDLESAESTLDLLTVDEPDRKIVRVCRSSRRGSLARMDFDFLVANAGGTESFAECHEMRLFDRQEHVDAMEAAGLSVTVDEYGLWGHGLVLGVSPA